jgi:hypothetical protein
MGLSHLLAARLLIQPLVPKLELGNVTNRRIRVHQRSNPSRAGGSARGFLPAGVGVADFKVLVQGVFDIKGVGCMVACHIKRLRTLTQLHLVNRHPDEPPFVADAFHNRCYSVPRSVLRDPRPVRLIVAT